VSFEAWIVGVIIGPVNRGINVKRRGTVGESLEGNLNHLLPHTFLILTQKWLELRIN